MWALRTSPHTITGEITFSLVFGVEAVIPAKIGMRPHRTTHFDEEANQAAMRLNLDLIDEFKEATEIKKAVRA